MHLSFPEGFERSLDLAALFAWVVGREGVVRSLHVDLSTPAAWPPLLAVLGVLGRQLLRLRLAGETPACQRPGCAAPWLALVPNLTCLELDDAVDGSIAAARFPPGALLSCARTLAGAGAASARSCWRWRLRLVTLAPAGA